VGGNLLFLVIAFAGFAGVLTLGLAFAGGGGGGTGKSAKRLSSVTSGGRPEARLKSAKTGDAAVTRRKQILESLKAQERLERKAKVTISARLQQAGLSISARTFWIVSAGLALVVGFLAGTALHSPLAAAGAAFVGGFGLPRWVLGVMCKGRLKKFTEEFPNSVDVIVRGIKSGLPVHDCLDVIARESPEPLAGEFRRLMEGLGMGQELSTALDKMYTRMPTSEVRFFSIVMAIQQKTGGNLSEALTNLSTVLRARKLMREKIKAMSGEAVASAAIIGCLPPGLLAVVSLIQPSYMMVMFTDPRGHIALMAGGTIMALGVFIMRRMINFKF
jgi:tight adherence protein B